MTKTADTYQTSGKFGRGEITRLANGCRQVQITFWNGTEIEAESQRVDLQTAKARNLEEAVSKACHALGFLPLFEKIVINGTQALINCYRRPNRPETGWANIIKRGVKPNKFSLERIDLVAMKATTISEALHKVAFDTGIITFQKD